MKTIKKRKEKVSNLQSSEPKCWANRDCVETWDRCCCWCFCSSNDLFPRSSCCSCLNLPWRALNLQMRELSYVIRKSLSLDKMEFTCIRNRFGKCGRRTLESVLLRTTTLLQPVHEWIQPCIKSIITVDVAMVMLLMMMVAAAAAL